MQAIENWAIVSGRVESVKGSAVRLAVTSAKAFEEYPNLCEWAVGKELKVELPSGSKPPEVGDTVEWRVRVVRPGTAMAHPSSLG